MSWVYRDSPFKVISAVIAVFLLWSSLVILSYSIVSLWRPGWLLLLSIIIGIILAATAIYYSISTLMRIQVRKGELDLERQCVTMSIGSWYNTRLPFGKVERIKVVRYVGVGFTEWLVFIQIKNRYVWMLVNGFRVGEVRIADREHRETAEFVSTMARIVGCDWDYCEKAQSSWRVFPW